MDPLDRAHDFNTDDARLLATRGGQPGDTDPGESWAFYEHPRHGKRFPIVAVETTTGLKFNTFHHDIDTYLYGTPYNPP